MAISMRNWLRGAAAGLVLLAPGTAAAAKGGAGATSAQFLKIGVGARALAMGGAYASVSGDAHAVYWNPAGLSGIRSAQLASSYNVLYQDTSQGFMGYAQPTRIGVWGAGVNYLQVTGIEKRSGDTAAPSADVSAGNSAAFIAYAAPGLWGDISLGLTAKRVALTLDGKTGSAFAADIGLRRQAKGSPFSLGFSVLNLGGDIQMGTGKDPLPLGLKAGASYGFFRGGLLVAAGAEAWPEEDLTYAQLGVEWKPTGMLALRAGPQMGGLRQDLGNLVGMSAGMGFRLGRLDVDYAYVPFGDLGDTNRLSLRLSF